MATLHDIVAVEAEFTALLNNPRRPLTRFIEVSLSYGQMMAEQDPRGALEALSLAIETLHDPPAPAEVDVALGLLRTMREVASELGVTAHELDAITREQHILDGGLAPVTPGEREALSRRAAAVRFETGEVEAGFHELVEGLRNCEEAALEGLASDMLLALRRIPMTEALIAEIEALWVFLRRHRRGGTWELWCLVALGAVRLKVGDAITAKMYLRRAEATLAGGPAPVVAALVNGWVALASAENSRARISFTYAVRMGSTDTRVRLLASAGLGEALHALGRVDEALKPLNEAIGYDVGDPNTVARCHELLSQIAADDGRFHDAYEHLLFARLLERPSVKIESALRRRPTVVDLRDEGGSEPLPAEPPLRTVSAQIAEQTLVANMGELGRRDALPVVIDAGDDEDDTAPITSAGAPSGVVPTEEPADRLDLVLAPIVENASGRVGAAEASLRLVRSDGSIASAMSLATANDLRSQVLQHTLRRCCRLLSEFRGEPMALLVDATSVPLDADLVSMVSAELNSVSVDAAQLIVAVSGAALVRTAHGRGHLASLRELGVGVALSGLGSTFTSSDVLLASAVDVALVDMSVLELAAAGGPQRRVIDAAASLARGFGFDLIATGVDSAERFDLQLQFGCHGVVGSYAGEPMVVGERCGEIAEVFGTNASS